MINRLIKLINDSNLELGKDFTIEEFYKKGLSEEITKKADDIITISTIEVFKLHGLKTPYELETEIKSLDPTKDESKINSICEKFETDYTKLNKEISGVAETSLKLNLDLEYSDIFYNALCGIDTETLTELLNLKRHGLGYDAYGTDIYTVEDKDFVIFSTDDNGSMADDTLISLCCYDIDNNILELADVSYDDKNKSFSLIDIQKGKLPEEVIKLGVEAISGKRSFYWDKEEKIVRFRIHEDTWNILSDDIKAESFYNKNVSGSRLKVQLV